jgi:hypothetical protein
VFALSFGVNYGSFKTTVSFLPSMFDRSMADDGNLTSYAVLMAMALLLAAPLVELSRHPKWVLVASFALWGSQHLLLSVASVIYHGDSQGPNRHEHVPPYAVATVEFCVVAASVLGGTSAALAWTAQGVYLAFAARKHAVVSGVSVVDATARFAAIFACLELATEATCRFGFAAMLSGSGFAASHFGEAKALFLLSMLCFSGMAATCYADDLTYAGDAELVSSQGGKAPDGRSDAIQLGCDPVRMRDRGLRSAVSVVCLLATSLTAVLLQTIPALKGFSEVALIDCQPSPPLDPFLTSRTHTLL